ncbi:hypothetical protein L5F32_03745 [Aliarcobacter butzleri]|uniref:hypothetical protein n=1 Tax=Aliarcobacter butzleri TaxID=28197 RepID=UPI001EDC3F9C|nr:hypothetical protein [Aliarcobacter butzleri]MCG3651381.1 hypothetical protein [Aliarcobacter butzleri]
MDYLNEKSINRNDLSIVSIRRLWFDCFNLELTEKNVKRKLKFFKKEKNKFNILYVNKLPHINKYSLTLLILLKEKENFLKNWQDFKKEFYKSSEAFYELKEKNFKLPPNINDYKLLLDESFNKDESIRSENSEKKIYLLFFLFLAGKGHALLPSLYIFSSDSFFYYATNQKILEFFQKKHFFITMPHQKHLIENELNGNNKAKYIFYLRFSYLVNSSIEELKEISDQDLSGIFLSLKNSNKSTKMTDDNENPLRKILIWHGAINISENKKLANKIILSPLEILFQSKDKNLNLELLDIFAKNFSNKPNNTQQRRLADFTVDFLIYLNSELKEISFNNLRNFFSTSIVLKDNFTESQKSDFLTYLEDSKYGKSFQQDLQFFVFQVIESSDKYAGCYTKSSLVTIYKTPNKRKISRLAFDKKIINKMKYICLFNPPSDNYYIKTNINKNNMLWQHFDIVEPQLPIMLFLHLSMPWRTEHIISLDRDTFLVKDQDNNIIAWKITTDKNQDNDFQIEIEFINHVFFFEDEDGDNIDVIRLLEETIEYSIESFPSLKSLYRKENTNWGKIKPILCGKNAIGFIKNEIYSGYYYKVLLKTLFELNYSIDEIEYYVQLTDAGRDFFKIFPESYDDRIEKLSLYSINKYFSSEYYNPHSLRKTNITHLVQNGKIFEFILKLSGHTARSTVLQVYIDYEYLAKLSINQKSNINILEKFESNNTRLESRKIISNLRKYHTTSIEEIKNILKEKELFFSPLILSNNRKYIEKNNQEKLEILHPKFWQDLSTGICSNALNCPELMNNCCSLCPFFITGPVFFSAINSKIMQLSTKISEYYKIIEDNLINENLNNNEAELYEEELQLLLSENHGYSAIIENFNIIMHEFIKNDFQNNKLPSLKNFSLIKYEHVPFYKAQLEIYKISKKNNEHNFSTKFAIEEVYKKILELILLNEIPKDIFYNKLSSKEEVIDTFIAHLDSSNLASSRFNLLN